MRLEVGAVDRGLEPADRHPALSSAAQRSSESVNGNMGDQRKKPAKFISDADRNPDRAMPIPALRAIEGEEESPFLRPDNRNERFSAAIGEEQIGARQHFISVFSFQFSA